MPPAPYGGYGAYGGYGRFAAPKPGVIPLRPLTFGEILDGAFSAIRWNPKTILTSSAVVAAISGVLFGLVTFFLQRDVLINVSVQPSGALTPTLAGNLVITSAALLGATAAITFFANTILTGMLAVTIGQGVLGRKETLGRAWRGTRSRIGALLGTVLLAAVFLGGGWTLAVALAVGVGAAFTGTHAAGGVLVGVFVSGAATVFAVITLVRWTVAIPVVMLESAGPLKSLRRSWRLVRRSSWRVLGILLATALIVGIANLIIGVPFALASGIGGFATPQAQVSVVGVIVSAVGQIVATTVTAPLLAGVVVLLYADLRMRREGMDIMWQAAAVRGAPGGEGAGGQNLGPW